MGTADRDALSNAPNHCVKGASIRNYSGSHFPALGLNTERYEVSLRIQSKCGKMLIKITPNVDTFYAVNILNIFETLQQIVGRNV